MKKPLCWQESQQPYYISVDETDFQILEQAQSKQFYSDSSKKAGYRYKIALRITTGDIVWTKDSFPCRAHPDIKIFRKDLKRMLRLVHEKTMADIGYRGEARCINIPN